MFKPCKLITILVLIGMLLSGLTGCATPAGTVPENQGAESAESQGAESGMESEQAEGAAPSGEPIKIGAALSLTGYLALEQYHAEAAQLAVDYLNANGGILGRPVELFIEDVKSDPAQCATVVTKHIVQNEVDAIISGASSAGNEASVPIVAENEIPTVINSVLPADPTWMVSTLPTVKLFISTQFQFLKSIGVTTVGDIHNPTPYNQFMVATGQSVGEELGISFVASEEVAADSTTMVIPLTNIQKAEPGAVVSFVSGGPTALVGKDMAALGMTIPLILTSDDLSNLKTAAEAYANAYFPLMPVQTYPDVVNAEMKANLDSFMPFWDEIHPDSDALYAAAGWDQIMILAQAMEAAGTTEGKAVMAELESLEHVGIEAVYEFTPDDHAGIKTNPLRMAKVEDGKVTIVFVPE